MTQPIFSLFPPNNAQGVNPDTHLVLTFAAAPILGASGQIRIYDTADDRLVDLLDLSIPAGPTTGIIVPAVPPYTPLPYEYNSTGLTNANTKPGTPSGAALPASADYQLTIIGGFSDGFHFYPVIVHGNTATIYPHNNLLKYGRGYYVEIDPGVLTLSAGGFAGITGKTSWTFSTRPAPPASGSARLVVSGDGSGDFNTVQGAVDSIPDHNSERVTIFIKNGVYEEIVYFRNKANITFLGEDREKVVVCYPNNEVFNPHPANVATNEMPGTFPERRAAFMGDHSHGIHLVNFTVKSTVPHPGQAEGLLLVGGENIVCQVTIEGSGDALQVNDSAYLLDCRIVGDGDNILGRGPAFFDHCDFVTQGGPHMWIRNTAANHGNVFLNCTFRSVGQVETVIARSPTNHGKNYPYAEAVLINCALAGILPEGWGPIGGDLSAIHFWEYHSTRLGDGQPLDVSRRHFASRQLTLAEDAAIIASYSDPTFVLGGWTPTMAPLFLAQPACLTAAPGQSAIFSVRVAALPAASYQWFKNGAPIPGATDPVLKIENLNPADTASYTVSASNPSSRVSSEPASLKLLKA